MVNPSDAKSRLPPQTVAKMRKLNTEYLRLYANDLLSSYDTRSRKLRAVGTRMAEDWVIAQAAFLDSVAEELRQIIQTGEAP